MRVPRGVSSRTVIGAGAVLLLVIVAFSASVRHAVVCEKAPDEETVEAGTHMARDALSARMLSVEQEALENQLVTRRVVAAVDASKGATTRALGATSDHTFAAAYADAAMFAQEVDAAFDAFDERIEEELAWGAYGGAAAGEADSAGGEADWAGGEAEGW
mmetsp:Transcript_15305/g.47528  ORF Transcript_15305/g.47528 Transcript_15305/m.47528 type:complete len:160 (-) Transcript_15305:184-663(-)